VSFGINKELYMLPELSGKTAPALYLKLKKSTIYESNSTVHAHSFIADDIFRIYRDVFQSPVLCDLPNVSLIVLHYL
jgi:hypothetical protein